MAASDAIVAARGLLTALQAATAGFDKASSADVDLSKAQADLRKLRMHMTEFPGLPPSAGTDEASREQQVIARAALEQACLIAVRAGDGAALERAWAQLVPYYGDLAAHLPTSSERCKVVGLYLLHLLVSDQTSTFLCELELLSDAERTSAEVAYPATLQSWMTEGAFNRVLDAASKPPSVLFGPMVASIAVAVRSDVARCAESSYASLRAEDAAAMLKLDSVPALRDYAAAEHPTWTFRDSPGTDAASSSSSPSAATAVPGTRVWFSHSAASTRVALPAAVIIDRTLQYANDVERIV